MTLHADVLAAAICRATSASAVTARLEAEAILDELARFGWRLTDVADLAEQARARKADPDTSRVAADSIDNLSARHAGVLHALYEHGPLTDGDLCARYPGLTERFGADLYPPQSPASLRSRRAELVAAGHVEPTGDQGISEHGRPCNVWRAVR